MHYQLMLSMRCGQQLCPSSHTLFLCTSSFDMHTYNCIVTPPCH